MGKKIQKTTKGIEKKSINVCQWVLNIYSCVQIRHRKHKEQSDGIKWLISFKSNFKRLTGPRWHRTVDDGEAAWTNKYTVSCVHVVDFMEETNLARENSVVGWGRS